MSLRRSSVHASLVACVLAGCGGASPCPAPIVAAQEAAVRPEPSRLPPRLEAPEGFVPMAALGVFPGPEGNMLLLGDGSRERVIPILIGDAEAMVIDLRVRGEHFERPLTHDIIDTLVAELRGEILMVEVNKVREGIFVGTISLWNGREVVRIDARTSDAVAVALGHELPIYVSASVIDESAVDVDALVPGGI